MSKKSELKKAIQESENELENLEKKRIRSQSALLEAFLNHTEPDPTDKEYFQTFTSLIELERENLRKLYKQMDELENA